MTRVLNFGVTSWLLSQFVRRFEVEILACVRRLNSASADVELATTLAFGWRLHAPWQQILNMMDTRHSFDSSLAAISPHSLVSEASSTAQHVKPGSKDGAQSGANVVDDRVMASNVIISLCVCLPLSVVSLAGTFEMRVYKHAVTGLDAIAMVARVRHGGQRIYASAAVECNAARAGIDRIPDGGVVVRVQDQCMTSEIFGSVKCDCKQQLDYSLSLLHLQAERKFQELQSDARRAVKVAAPPTADDEPGPRLADTTSVPSAAPTTCACGGDCAHEPTATASTSSVSDGPISDSESSISVAPCGVARDGARCRSLTSASQTGGRNQPATATSTADHDEKQLAAASVNNSVEPEDDSIVGVICYLLQEGRGIGLAAKVQAYALQESEELAESQTSLTSVPNSVATASLPRHSHADDQLSPIPAAAAAAAGLHPVDAGQPEAVKPKGGRGLDTVDANRALGLPDDVREYSAVADILHDLGLVNRAEAACGSLYLLTNNPRKVDKMRELGLPMAGRLPCHLPPVSPLAAQYLRTKVERMGHDIPAHLFDFAGGAVR